MGEYIIRGGRASGRTLRVQAEIAYMEKVLCSDIEYIEIVRNSELPNNMAFIRRRSLLENVPKELKETIDRLLKQPQVNIEEVELKKETPAEAICTAGRKAIMEEVVHAIHN